MNKNQRYMYRVILAVDVKLCPDSICHDYSAKGQFHSMPFYVTSKHLENLSMLR